MALFAFFVFHRDENQNHTPLMAASPFRESCDSVLPFYDNSDLAFSIEFTWSRRNPIPFPKSRNCCNSCSRNGISDFRILLMHSNSASLPLAENCDVRVKKKVLHVGRAAAWACWISRAISCRFISMPVTSLTISCSAAVVVALQRSKCNNNRTLSCRYAIAAFCR